jgi:hypothetical protein
VEKPLLRYREGGTEDGLYSTDDDIPGKGDVIRCTILNHDRDMVVGDRGKGVGDPNIINGTGGRVLH